MGASAKCVAKRHFLGDISKNYRKLNLTFACQNCSRQLAIKIDFDFCDGDWLASEMRIFLLVLCAVLLHSCLLSQQQQVISVQTGVTCLSIPENGLIFKCGDPGTEFVTTVLNLLINPNSGSGNTVSFDVKLTSLPQVGGSQDGTADTCTDPDILGLCTASTNATLTFTATPPTLVYNLVPIYQDIPYAYFSDTVTSAIDPNTVTDTTSMNLQNIQVLSGPVQNVNHFANSTFRNAAWFGPNAKQYYKCAPSDYPNSSVFPNSVDDSTVSRPAPPLCVGPVPELDTPGVTMNYVSATWKTKDQKKNDAKYFAKTTSAAVEVGPICSVFRVSPRPTLSTKLTVTVVANQTVRTLILPNVGVGSTQATPEGDFLFSIQDLPTPDGYFGPYVEGFVVICGSTRDSILNFTMVPPGADPGQNPWSAFSDPSYRTFTPENIAYMRGSTTVDPYSFAYFINSTAAQAIGDRCTQLGVTQSFATSAGFNSLILNIASSLGISKASSQIAQTLPLTNTIQGFQFNKIVTGMSKGLTCAPQFPNTFLSLPIVTPCQDLMQQYAANGNADSPLSGVLPPQFNRVKPNIWFDKTTMRMQLPNNIQIRGTAAFNGQLVQARGSVSYGTFQPSGSSCLIDANPAAKNGSIYLQVCNESQYESSYIISSTCVGGAGVTVAGGGSITTTPIPAQQCLLVNITLNVEGQVVDGAVCSSTLLPINGPLDINNVKTSTLDLQCVAVSSVVPPAIRKPSDILNYDITAVPTPMPDFMEPQSDSEYNTMIVALVVTFGIFVLVFVVLVVLGVVEAIRTESERKKVEAILKKTQ